MFWRPIRSRHHWKTDDHHRVGGPVLLADPNWLTKVREDQFSERQPYSKDCITKLV